MSFSPRMVAAFSALLLSFSIASAYANDVVSTDVLSNCDAPSYDKKAVDKDEEGSVKLALMLGEDGKVMDARVLTSSGYDRLDKASLRAVQGCTLKPGLASAKNAWTNLTFSWVLN